MTTEPTANPDGRLNRIIRERDLPTYTGLRKTQIAAEIRAGTFPKPIKLTEAGRAKGWLENELIAWQTKRLLQRAAEQPPSEQSASAPGKHAGSDGAGGRSRASGGT